jgi:4-hydroxy-tetrahydrodipicolinate reductase
VVLCTSSSLKKVWPQIEEVLKLKGADRLDDGGAGVSGVLAQGPGRAHRQGGAEGESRRAGDGRQPGLHDGRTADHAHRRLRQCRIHHGQPDSGRAFARLPFQQKIGCGLTPAQFQARVDAGTVRHVGLTESIAMIADAMGWKLDRVTDQIRPQVAAAAISSEFLTVQPGQVCG